MRNNVRSKTQFFCGDWDTFSTYHSSALYYDYILCSELLYNAKSYRKLGDLFNQKLRSGGKMYPFSPAKIMMFFLCIVNGKFP